MAAERVRRKMVRWLWLAALLVGVSGSQGGSGDGVRRQSAFLQDKRPQPCDASSCALPRSGEEVCDSWGRTHASFCFFRVYLCNLNRQGTTITS